MELENNVISYKDFCEKYAKEMNDVRKYNIAYGSKLEDPIRSDLILFVGSNLKDSDELSSIISDTLTNKGKKKVVAIAQQETDAEILKIQLKHIFSEPRNLMNIWQQHKQLLLTVFCHFGS